MVRISIFHPVTAGARFDVHDYIDRHMPMALERLGAAIKGVRVEVGAEAASWPAPTFVAACHYLCDSREVFEAAYAEHAGVLQADIANYTDIAPVIQISEVRLAR